MMRWMLASSVWSTATLVGALVLAQERPIPIHVVEQPGSVCQGAWQLEAEIRARSPRARPAVPTEAQFIFHIDVRYGADGLLGRLQIREPIGHLALREVPGRTCPEIISAMGLIGAVYVDPAASTAPVRVALPSVTAAGTAGQLSPPPPSVPGRPRRLAFSVAAGVGLDVHSGAAPWPAYGPSVEIATTARRDSGAQASLTLVRIANGKEEGPYRGDFVWLAGRLIGCPLAYSPVSTIRLRPCLCVEAGRTSVLSSAPRNPGSYEKLWLAGGASGRVDWHLSPPLSVTLEVGAVLPAPPRDYYFGSYMAGGDVFFRVHRVEGFARVGLLAHLF